MSKTKPTLLLALLLLAGSVAPSVMAQRAKPAPKASATADYRVAGITVKTYSPQENSFSEDITKQKDLSFFNEVGLSLFAVIEITGPAGAYESQRQLSILVTEGKKVKVKRIDYLGIINQDGHFYVPVLVNDGFCENVTIQATLLGQRTKSSKSVNIPFACGE